MKRIKIAVADENRAYLDRLIQAFEQYPDFEVSSFGSGDRLEKALDEKRYDIVLSDPAFLPIKTGARTVQILLSDDRSGITADLEDLPRIEKFQRCDKIQRAILEIYAACSPESSHEGKAQLVLVFSPIGGSGKTTVALGIAARIAAQGNRVLYQNFEEIPSCQAYLPDREGKGISDLLAELDENLDFSLLIQSMIQNRSENLFYFNTFRTPNDFLAMTDKDTASLFETLQGCGLFDVVVIDAGCSISSKNAALFDLADRIIVVACPGETATAKLDLFYAQKYLMNRYEDKMVQVNNFDSGRPVTSGSCNVLGGIPAYDRPDCERLIAAISSDQRMRFLGQVL
ncbi:MAG: hypothetical protein K6G16_10930 [Lachnospiraceae bacterium]|nr:hypothetical protein [Lachnospiraceae bacterium]